MKRESTLTNWTIVDRGGLYCLRGDTLNDDRFKNGETVTTSMLEKIDFVKSVAETKNTIYRLR